MDGDSNEIPDCSNKDSGHKLLFLIIIIFMLSHIAFFKSEIIGILGISKIDLNDIGINMIFKSMKTFLYDRIDFFKDLIKPKIKLITNIKSTDITEKLTNIINDIKVWTLEGNEGGVIGKVLLLLVAAYFILFIASILVASITGGLFVGTIFYIVPILFALLLICLILTVITVLYEIYIKPSDNILNCALGLKPSGKVIKNMNNKQEDKMNMCKFLMKTSAPTILWSYGNKFKNFRITSVLKNVNNVPIHLILPGHVSFEIVGVQYNKTTGVLSLTEIQKSNFESSGSRIVYIDKTKLKMISSNQKFNKYKDYIYEYDKLEDQFEKDYKNNMMKYYGFTNIYYYILLPLSVMIIVNTVIKLIKLTSIPVDRLTDKSVVDSTPLSLRFLGSTLMLLINLGILWQPMYNIITIIAHGNLIDDNIIGEQIQFLLISLPTIVLPSIFLLVNALTSDVEVLKDFSVRSTFFWGGVILFSTMAFRILFNDKIECIISGKNFCPQTIFTSNQQRSMCEKLSIKTDPFTNRSNNKRLNFVNIEEYTTNDGDSEVPTIEETDTVKLQDYYKCNKGVMSTAELYEESWKKYMASWKKLFKKKTKRKSLIKAFMVIINFMRPITIFCILLIKCLESYSDKTASIMAPGGALEFIIKCSIWWIIILTALAIIMAVIMKTPVSKKLKKLVDKRKKTEAQQGSVATNPVAGKEIEILKTKEAWLTIYMVLEIIHPICLLFISI